MSPASPAQKEKISMERYCMACGIRSSAFTVIDPAHLCARARGGCDDPECVVPLCRSGDGSGCHKEFDEGRLDLSVKLEPRWREEVAHCVMHLGLFGAVRRITGDRNYGQRSAA